MPKFTRRIKNNKKNRTIKRGGDSNIESPNNNNEGVVDIVANKLYNVGSSIATGALDTGLKIVGLERVDKSKEDQEETQKVDQNIEKIGDAASGIISDVGNVVDKTGSAVIQNVNEVLGSNIVQESASQAAEDTAEIVKQTAEKFNNALNDPEVKEEVVEAINNASEIAAVGIKAFEKPAQELTNVAAKSFQKAEESAAEGAVKTVAAIAAATPGLGALIDLGMAANSASRALRSVSEAGSETTQALSRAIIDTKNNFEQGMSELEKQKKIGDEITNRTGKSWHEFENPIPQMRQFGGKKTRRRLTKRKAKSKRVRFAI